MPSRSTSGSRPVRLSSDPLMPQSAPSLNPPMNPSAAANMFTDPYTSMFENLAKTQINRLSQPFEDSSLDEVMGLIRSRIGATSAMAPPSFVGNSFMGDFANQARQRISELNQEPFSAQEEDRLKTGALEAIEKNRSSSKQRALENISRRGIADTSGVLLELERDIDRGADSDRATSEREFANFVTSERNRRRDAATGIAGQLAAAGAQEAQMANSNAMASSNFELGKSGQIMGMASQLAGLAAQRRGEQRAREGDILAIAQSLSNLAPQRLALMMSVLGGQPTPESVFNNTLNLSNTQGAYQQQNNAGNAGMMSAIGQLLGFLAAQGGGGK